MNRICDVGPKMPNVQSAHVQSTWRHLAFREAGYFPGILRVSGWICGQARGSTEMCWL
jgi:hypothetical protein